MKRLSRKSVTSPFQRRIKWFDTFTGAEEEEVLPHKSHVINLFIGTLFVVFVFSYIFWGLIDLQIVHGASLRERSVTNHLTYEPIDSDRGIIYDVNGVKLVENVNGYKLVVKTSVGISIVAGELDALSGVSGIGVDDLTAKYTEAYENNPLVDIVLVENCPRELVLKFKAIQNRFEYISLVETKYRNYLGTIATSHVIGYTGEASDFDIERNNIIIPGDIVGKEGIEYSYDSILRGVKGQKIIEVDALNNPVSSEFRELTNPIEGASLYLSLDIVIQEKAYELLQQYVPKYEGTAGVIILQNVNSGKIIALTNYPGYDNNLFVGGISESELPAYQELITNPAAPLLNRAIAGAQPPGSTFKILMAQILLHTGAITPNTIINSTGVTYIGEDKLPIQEYHGHVYGPLNVVSGICKSSNIFFCRGFIDSDLSINELDNYLVRYGIGSKTGIDLPGESKGVLPSPENKAIQAEYATWLDPYWYLGDSCVTAFGQGITLVTPIQLLGVSTYIANGGILWQPTIVDKIVYPSGEAKENFAEIRDRDIVSKSVLDYVRQGMECTANTGGGVIVPFFNSEVRVAAKTGTAEFGLINEKGYYEHTHAWVTGYFPAENPQYSFVVFIEDGGESNNAATVMRELIDFMLDLGYIKK
ncbi:hypothetical protein JW962_01700 [Candidatus Dojkabacteria bacterium]|nr:hypothetical protein [Candidatus Dojkabacteria bacterium]